MIFLKILYFYLPVMIANMTPVLVRNNFKFLAKPVDNNKTWRNKPIFGPHKTWRGLITATITGGIIYIIQYLLALNYPKFNNLPFDYLSVGWWFGFLFAGAAITGDLIESFFKRRVKLKPGAMWFPWDQIDFIIPSTIVVIIFFPFKQWYWSFVIIGILLHILINHIGYWLKIKNSPW